MGGKKRKKEEEDEELQPFEEEVNYLGFGQIS